MRTDKILPWHYTERNRLHLLFFTKNLDNRVTQGSIDRITC